jgi:Raf kinase inhibitor-like YbhB/YbcL family protein
MSPHTKHEEAEAVDYKLLKVSSTAFSEKDTIPQRHTCDGVDVNPPLDIEGIPEEAICLAIIVDDPDAPSGNWTHWLIWNIPITHHIKENDVHGVQGFNDFKKQRYNGPCPPSGQHRYFFKVYALEKVLELPAASVSKHDLEKAMSSYILAFGELVGVYTRK